MIKETSKKIVKDTLDHAFEKERFVFFIKNLLNSFDESKAEHFRGYIKHQFKQATGIIKTYERIGTYTDPEDKTVDILVVYLQKENSIERARTSLRNFVANHLKQRNQKDAALVAFVSPNNDDWRFSLIKMDYKFHEGKSGKVKVKEEFTPARRWSFLVGAKENSHTAQSRLAPILEDDTHNPTLSQIEKAFDIETVTKEFFEKYRELFLNLNENLDRMVEKDTKIRKDFEEKDIEAVDFAKKLLGQIVFLYFLQKKGWFGVERDADWGTGPKDFLRQLFEEKHGTYTNFFNEILEPLFYASLARERDDNYSDKFNCKIPFLNGGLFDPIGNYDWVHTDILLENNLFSNRNKTKEGDIGDGILDIFDRYNFTVREDEPLEKEVAVDPEMLGKVFENLLEVKDRKSKGTYYTPREIVHYMCEQSLINYLTTELKNVVNKEEIEDFINNGDLVLEHEYLVVQEGESENRHFEIGPSIIANAKLVDEKLADIKVCDPAIGSGAFPVGMMNEIVNARLALNPYINDESRTAYDFKNHAITNSLYGVDIDPGAVEIAKLRLWLSLVVDENDLPAPRQFFVYVIRCDNDSLYIGQTEDLVTRWKQHCDGKASWTSRYKPVEIVHYETFETREEAVEREKKLKTGFGRKWLKRELAEGRLKKWDSLAARQAGIKQIKPLPNLDYKVMQGNSLLEEFEGIKLFDESIIPQNMDDREERIKTANIKINELQREFIRLHTKRELSKTREIQINKEIKEQQKLVASLNEKPKSKAGQFNFDGHQNDIQEKWQELTNLHKGIIGETNRDKKKTMLSRASELEWQFIEASLKTQISPPARGGVRGDGSNLDDKLKKIAKYKKLNTKPFFLWHLHFADVFKDGGFDVVIANPPYETSRSKGILENEKIYLKNNYVTAEDKFDYYTFFIEKSSRICRQKGAVCLITPSTYLTKPLSRKIRQFLLEKKINDIKEFKGLVFQAVVPTAIILFQNEIGSDNHLIEIGYDIGNIVNFTDGKFSKKLLRQQLFSKDPNYYINIYSDEFFYNLLSKLQNSVGMTRLGILAEIYNGIQTGDDKKFVGFSKKSDEWQPVITGSDIRKYYLRWGGKYVFYKPSMLHSNTRENIFKTGEKLIIRQTADKIIGTYDSESYFTLASTFVIKQFEKRISYKVLLGIINSSLFVYLYRTLNNEAGRILPQIKKKHIFDLPIQTNIPSDEIGNAVEKILVITKDSNFLSDTTKQAQVRELVCKIDQLVYRLYNLTPEEVAVIERGQNG